MSDDLKEFIQQTYPQGTTFINLSVSYQIKIGPQGTKTIAETITWPITHINLTIYFIQNEGMQTLIKSGKQWPTLKQLLLEKNTISCEGMKGISQAGWNQLKRLVLNKNMIKATGFGYLVQANFPLLQILELSHSQIGLAGAMRLPEANWPKLQFLNLNYNMITCQGIRQLSKCKFPNLRNLQLSNNKLYYKSMMYLSRMPLPYLQYLNLNKNLMGRRQDRKSTELGCYYITKLQVKQLKAIRLFANDITLNGIRLILYSGILAQNCFLQIIRNYFEYKDIEEDVKICGVFSNQF